MKKGSMQWETLAKIIIIIIVLIIIIYLTYTFRDRMYEIVDKLRGIY